MTPRCPYIASSTNSTHLYSRISLVVLEAPIERHPHLPGPREHFRIFNRDFVHQVIGTDGRVALDDVQRVAVEVPGAVEPGLVVESQ